MPTSDPTDILLAHDRWATSVLLDACAALTDEQFHQRFDIGPGSLHDATRHILGAMRNWSDLLARRELRPRLEATPHSIAELRSLLDEVYADFAQQVRSHPMDGLVSRERGGTMYTFTRGAVFTHVATHGMHHRAQCLNMLRRLGVAEQPMSSIMQWAYAADPAEPVSDPAKPVSHPAKPA